MQSSRHFPQDLPVYGLRARGVDKLVEPHESVEAMAAKQLTSIRQLETRGPYFIGGSCVGGIVALEIAQQLRAADEKVAQLILIGSQFPTRSDLFRYGLNVWRDELRPTVERCREHPADFFKAINEQLRLSLAPSKEQKIAQEKVRIGKRYLRGFLQYLPRPYTGPVTMIGCKESAARAPPRAAARSEPNEDKQTGPKHKTSDR
jgi:thioesterase domain-containing protein